MLSVELLSRTCLLSCALLLFLLLRFFQCCLLIPCFSSFFLQSLPRDHPLQAFHHLPRIFHFSNQPRHLCTPLAREDTSALPHLGPGDGAPDLSNCIQLLQFSQTRCMLASYSFPPCCHDRVDQSSRSSV